MGENLELKTKVDQFLGSEDLESHVYLIFKDYSTCTFDLIDEKNTFLAKYREKLPLILKSDIVDFDPSISIDGSIEKIISSDVPNLNLLKQNLNPFNSTKISDIELQPNNIWGIVNVFKNKEDKTLKIFRKYINSKISQESRMLRIVDGTMELIDGEILMFDLKIDAIEYENYAYIINRFYFRQLFAFNEKFLEYVKNSLDTLKEEDVIVNFDEFAEHGLDSSRVVNRFITVIKENRLVWLKENINSAKKVAEEFKLKIEFEGDRILYSKKSCSVNDVMILICGLCVRDAVDRRKYIAAATKEVKDE